MPESISFDDLIKMNKSIYENDVVELNNILNKMGSNTTIDQEILFELIHYSIHKEFNDITMILCNLVDLPNEDFVKNMLICCILSSNEAVFDSVFKDNENINSDLIDFILDLEQNELEQNKDEMFVPMISPEDDYKIVILERKIEIPTKSFGMIFHKICEKSVSIPDDKLILLSKIIASKGIFDTFKHIVHKYRINPEYNNNMFLTTAIEKGNYLFSKQYFFEYYLDNSNTLETLETSETLDILDTKSKEENLRNKLLNALRSASTSGNNTDSNLSHNHESIDHESDRTVIIISDDRDRCLSIESNKKSEENDNYNLPIHKTNYRSHIRHNSQKKKKSYQIDNTYQTYNQNRITRTDLRTGFPLGKFIGSDNIMEYSNRIPPTRNSYREDYMMHHRQMSRGGALRYHYANQTNMTHFYENVQNRRKYEYDNRQMTQNPYVKNIYC